MIYCEQKISELINRKKHFQPEVHPVKKLKSDVCSRWRFDWNVRGRISLCTDIAHEKKIAGLPQIWILTLSLRNLTRPNFCIQACTREYAAHQGKRELVSMVSV